MIIDMHNHVIAPASLERILAEPEQYGARVEQTPRGQSIFFADTMQQPGPMWLPWWPKFTDLEGDKAHLRDIGADGAVLSAFIGLHRYTLPLEPAIRLCRTLNDGLSEWIRGEDTLKAMATVPLQDGAAAAEELRRCTQDLGLAGAMILTHLGNSQNLDQPHLEPFWEAAEALNAPLFFHPTDVAAKDRLSSYGLDNLLGNPFDTTIAVASLILSGTLERHPHLNIVLAHGGGYFPTVACGRLTHGYYHNAEARSVATRPPEAYLSFFYYDTILYHAELIRHLVRMVGADRVMLGTDYPFNMEPPDAVRAIGELGLTPEETYTILHGAAKLYGFPA